MRIDVPILGVGPYQSHRLQRIVHRADFGLVAVLAEPIAQNHGIHPVIVKKWHKISAFGADVQRVVPAPGGQNHHSSRIQSAVDQMHLD